MQTITNKNIFFVKRGAWQGFDLASTYLYWGWRIRVT